MNARFGLVLGIAAAGAAFTGCGADGSSGPKPVASSGSAGLASAGGENAGNAGRALLEGGSGGESGSAADAGSGGEGGSRVSGPKTVLVVLEGLRSEFVSPELMPNLWRMAEGGVRFSNFGSVLPSNRMAAAGSLATGAVPARHGVLGERIYAPGASVSDAQGRAIDSTQPFSIEDQGTLESLRAGPGGFLHAKTLVEVAQAAGFRTAVIGRAGPASLFDIERQGMGLNDNYVWPRKFAERVNLLGRGLPNDVSALFPDLWGPSAYRPALEEDFYNYAGFQASQASGLQPRVSASYVLFLNPTLPALHTYDSARTLELAASAQVLAEDQSDLLVLWLRDVGETSVRTGPGAPAARSQVAKLDRALLDLESAIPEESNLIIVSDGGTSALAGDARFFPHWGVAKYVSGATNWVSVEVPGGVTTDGAVRMTDLLSRAGFLAYDGRPCLSGLAFTSYPTLRTDPTWPVACTLADNNGKGGEQTGPAIVPASPDPRAVIVASNGASELLYVPSREVSEVALLVAFLQSRPEIGAIFLAPRYGKLPGTLDLNLLGFSDDSALDLLVTYAWDSADSVGYGPQVDRGQLVTPGLYAACGPVTPCRPGLYCNTSGNPICAFCPSDQPRTYAACNVAQTAFEAAQAQSIYQDEGEACEDGSVCAPGLVCRTNTCRQPGVMPAPLLSEPPLGFVAGSSYGAMLGIAVSTALETAGVKLIADYHGVRGGSSPADLHGFLIARGPAFKSHVVVDVPSGIVDVAPTLLHALQPGLELQLGEIDGRVLDEALADSTKTASATAFSEKSEPASVPFYSPTKPDSTPASLLTAQGTYSSELTGFTVTRAGKQYRYWSQAEARRDSLSCNTSDDCPTGTECGAKHVCTVTPTCVDGVKNGLETDLDCGNAAKCFKCDAGKACAQTVDCESGSCVDSICK